MLKHACNVDRVMSTGETIYDSEMMNWNGI